MVISLNFSFKILLVAFQMTTEIWEYRLGQCKPNERNPEGAYILSVNISLLRKLRIQNAIKHSHAQRVMQLFVAGRRWLSSLLPAIISTIITRWLAFCWLQTIPVSPSFAYINWKLTRISRCVLLSPIQFYPLVVFLSFVRFCSSSLSTYVRYVFNCVLVCLCLLRAHSSVSLR